MKNRIISLLHRITPKKRRPTVGFLGLGKTNLAILNTLISSDIEADVRIRHRDRKALVGWESCPSVTLFHTDEELIGIDEDVLFASPSVRRENLITDSGTLVTSDTDIFFEQARDNLFLISGSSGKSTVTTLVSKMLSMYYPRLFTGGNLGTPIAECVLDNTDAVALELSSFNLQYITPASHRAIITNITPNHLDWHKDFTEYAMAKKNLLFRCDEPIINVDTPECARIAKNFPLFAVCSSSLTHAEIVKLYRTEHTVTVDDGIFVDGDKLLRLEDISQGQGHNLANLAGAIAMTLEVADASCVLDVARGFHGLEHRCEHFLTCGGVDFINSSIDTTPERTRATLEGLGKKVNILLGGRGKGLPLNPLCKPLSRYAKKIAIYGEMGTELTELIENNAELQKIEHSRFSRFCDALDYLTEGLEGGDTVILSPAATSYGEFSSYVERGELFKEIIRQKCEKI